MLKCGSKHKSDNRDRSALIQGKDFQYFWDMDSSYVIVVSRALLKFTHTWPHETSSTCCYSLSFYADSMTHRFFSGFYYCYCLSDGKNTEVSVI